MALVCSRCGSDKINKAGNRYTQFGKIQRFICKLCSFRFSQSLLELQQELNISGKAGLFKPSSDLAKVSICEGDFSAEKPSDKISFAFGENVGSHAFTVAGKTLNGLRSYSCKHRVGATQRSAKNLAIQTRQETSLREGISHEGKIVECMLYMKKKGLAEATIKSRIKQLKRLAKLGANLYDPESVKTVIANMKWCNGMKDNACTAYGSFVAMLDGKWIKPKYQKIEHEIFIPLPKEVDQFIASCSPMMSTYLQLLSETAMRPGEGLHLAWKDFDTAARIIRITPEKGSHSGTVRISEKLAAMIDSLPKTYTTIFCKPETNRAFLSKLQKTKTTSSLQTQKPKTATNNSQNLQTLQSNFRGT